MAEAWRALVCIVVASGCGGGSTPPGDDGGGMDAPVPIRDASSRDASPRPDAPGDDSGPPGGYDCSSPGPGWLMCDDFEAGDGDFETWFDASPFLTSSARDDRSRLDLSSDSPHAGIWALHMPAPASAGYQGADVGWTSCQGEQRTNCDPQFHERLYFRTWVRFANEHRYVHHFLALGGRDRFWAYGSAGCLPNGVSEMGTTVDFRRDTHESFFYTYHLDMSCDTACERYADVAAICAECESKGFPTCTDRPQCCWGNLFEPDPPLALPTGRWFCVEIMMQPNTPGENDGVMAYWVDDELALQVDTVRWRTTTDLGMSWARVQHYIAGGDADQSNEVWFDDVVVSTERIGCDSF